jgi:hypothetical protein
MRKRSLKLEAFGRSGGLLWQGQTRGPISGSAKALGDICIGQLNLTVSRTGVGEFIPGVGILEVPPQACHLSWEIIVAVFLGHNLKRDDRTEMM